MDEKLTVRIDQTPGKIDANFEELKEYLQEQMQVYKTIVYTDENIDTAKKDVAYLRKTKTIIEDKRKEAKKKCLAPYNALEKQVKELTVLIDEPIAIIADKVNEYEDRRRAAIRKKITDYMIEQFSDLPPEISAKARGMNYDPRWENKTMQEQEWKAAVDSIHSDVLSAIEAINGVDPDFRETAMKTYCERLSISEAFKKVGELQHQKEMLIERQRRREEEERRRKEAEAQRAAEAAAQAARMAENPVSNEKPQNYAPEMAKAVEKLNTASEPQYNEAEERERVRLKIQSMAMQAKQAEMQPDPNYTTVRFSNEKPELVKKILGYAKVIGIEFEVIA